MTLHLFNPEHDIALASNLAHFTAPHAGRQLRADLGWLPALWAKKDDCVLVDHVEYAERTWNRLRKRVWRFQPQTVQQDYSPIFVERRQLPSLDITKLEPWGWDAAMVTDLRRWGVSPDVLSSDNMLTNYRQLSHRRTSSQLLPLLRIEGTVGESVECRSLQEVADFQQRWGQVVVKAPWSSSGRGVQFAVQPGWVNNVIERQGSVMVEPFYNKVKDFGMEFFVDHRGRVTYLGLSLFHTKNGAYVGNLLATEQTKRQLMARNLPLSLLDQIKELIIENVKLPEYHGPFGVDMMVVKNGEKGENKGCLLHPCVEINLRRTMGHVALCMIPDDDELLRVMRIKLTEHYKLSINKL